MATVQWKDKQHMSPDQLILSHRSFFLGGGVGIHLLAVFSLSSVCHVGPYKGPFHEPTNHADNNQND